MSTRAIYFSVTAPQAFSLITASPRLTAMQMSGSLATTATSAAYIQVSLASADSLQSIGGGASQSTSIIGMLTLQSLITGSPANLAVFIPFQKPISVPRQIYIIPSVGGNTLNGSVVFYFQD